MLRIHRTTLMYSGLAAIISAGALISQSAAAFPQDQWSNQNSEANHVETFTGADGAPVTVEVDAPVRKSGIVVSLNDPSVVAQATKDAANAGDADLYLDYYLFYDAIQAVQKENASVLNIPKREYVIRTPPTFVSGTGIINFRDLTDVTVEGNGSLLLFFYDVYAGPWNPHKDVLARAALHITNDQRIILRNLTLDWATPLTYPVTITTNAQTHGLALNIDPAYPINPASPPPIRNFLYFDTVNRDYLPSKRMTSGQFAAWYNGSTTGKMPYLCPGASPSTDSSECYAYAGGQTYLFGKNEHFSPLPPNGTKMLAITRDNNFGAIVVDGGTSNISLEHITIYTSPGAGIQFLTAGNGIRIVNCAITRKPDDLLAGGEPPRMISTLSDGIDIYSTNGDIMVEDNEIGYEADDGLNINGSMRLASATGNATIVTTSAAAANYYKPGDLLNLYHSGNLKVVAKGVRIASVAPVKGQQWGFTLTLAAPVPGLSAVKDLELSNTRFASDNYIVRNNSFHDSFARGIALHGENGLVENNHFSEIAEAAVQVMVDNVNGQSRSSAAEGPPARNIVIRGNVINSANNHWYPPQKYNLKFPAAIDVFYVDGANGQAADPSSSQIAIENNTIHDVPGLGIFVDSARDVTVSGNHIYQAGLHDYGAPQLSKTNIVVQRGSNIRLTGNATEKKSYIDSPATGSDDANRSR